MHYLAGLLLLCLGSVRGAVQNALPAAPFLPGIRYVFGYGSSAALLEDLSLGVQGEISVLVVGDSEELLLTFNDVSLTWNTTTGSYVDKNAIGDLKNWFSALQTENGAISEVRYPRDEAPAVTAFKKSVAELLSVHSADAGREMIGGNLVVREAVTTQQGTREKTANRVTTYDSSGQLVSVEVEEVMTGQMQQTTQPSALLGFPIHSYTRMSLLRKWPDTTAPQTPTGLVTDTISTTEFKEVVPLAKIKTQISDKLACAVEDPRSSCMRESVSLLRLLSADDITTLAEPYLQVSLSGSSQKRALVLIDALSQLGSPEITTMLTQHVLRAPQHDNDLVLRTLFHLATAIQYSSNGAVARDVVDAVWDLVFDSSVSAAVQQRALLTLGAMAGVLRDRHPGLAREVVGSLHALLEEHTGIPAQATTLTKNKRSLPSTLSHSYDPQLHAILIDSLGNAGAEESVSTLTRHLREEGGTAVRVPLSVRHAAVKALRGFSNEESASALLQAVERSPHSTLGHVAARAYQDHPRRRRDLSHLLQPSESPSSPSLRSRRELSDNDTLVSNVTMPTVAWNNVLGEQNISAALGRRISNSFQLESEPLSSRYKFSLHDEASFVANLLLSNGEQHSEMLRTEFCLQGEASYDIDILSGFTQNLTALQKYRYDAVVGNLTENFQTAYDTLVASEPPYSGLSSSLSDTLGGLQERFAEVDSLLGQFQAEVDGIGSDFELKSRAEDIASDIAGVQSNASTMAQSSTQAISDSIDDILPARPQAVVSSLLVGAQPFTLSTFSLPYLPFAPQKAMANISTVFMRTGGSFSELQSAVEGFQSLTDPNGPNRQWLSPGVSKLVGNDISALLQELDEAINTADKSPTQSYDGASLSELISLRRAVTSDLQPAVVALDTVASELLAQAEQLDLAFAGTQEAFDTFTRAYEGARAEIDTIFGQRFRPEFPRRLRACDPTGSGCGTYPSTSSGLYRSGIDLRVEQGTQVMAPLTGYFQLLDPSTLPTPLSYDPTNSLILTPTESSFNGIYFIIANLRPEPSVVSSEPRLLLSGDVIGYPDDSVLVAEESFIHVEAYRVVDGNEYAIDPTQFLQPNLDPQVGIQFECNDLVTYVGGMVVDRWAIAPTELETVLIGDPLVNGVPDHEFPQPHDLILSAEGSMTSSESVPFFQSSTFIMVGPIPVQFDFSTVGQYQLNFSLSSALLSRSLEASVTPYLLARAEGTVRVGSTLFASVEIGGSVVETSLPLGMRQEFGDWPLRASSAMDLVLAPSTLTLTSQLVQLTGAGEFADQEILETDTLWRYSIPPLNRDEFYYDGTLSDVSPPQFIPLPYAESNQFDCFVRQLPGRQYGNPAFELEYEIAERESVVNATYRVGDLLSGENVISETELGGKRIVIPADLLLSRELYFTVSATNRNGLRTLASCLLPVYDRSPPMARINPIRPVSSHPSMIAAFVSLFDESGFEDSLEIAIGTVPGEYGDDVLSWEPFDVGQINVSPAEDSDVMNLFSFARTGRLVPHLLEVIPGLPSVDTCARQCADSASCRSFDYSPLETSCILHGSIEGPSTPPDADYENVFYTPPLRASRSYSHYERLGYGNSTVIEFSNLSLSHNTYYYLNMRLQNRLGYTSVASSSPFLVDLTPPTPGRIRNAASDVLQADGCLASVAISAKRCIEESGLQNHRVIVDGPGSAVIFNGPTPLLDAMYTATTNYITANWNSFQDAESGLYAYTWCMGTSIGSCDVVSSRDPHAHLPNQESWTNTGLATPENLSDGSYYVTVEAVNNVEYGAPLVTTVHHSTPYIVDTSSPVLVGVAVLDYNASSTELLLAYNASDPGSGIRSVSVALGRSELDTSIMEWAELVGGAGNEEVAVQVEVPSGVDTWVKVRATNNAGLQTIVVAANSPLMVDLTPPLLGYVRDGLEGDIDYQSDTSMLCINGGGSSDSESGIAEILWGIGTTRGASDVRGLTPLTPSEIARQQACASGLPLVVGTTYYSTLVVSNGAIDVLSVTVTSDGVLIDVSPPQPGSVFDGPIPQVSIEFSSNLTTVAANWDGFDDPESGISCYIVTLVRRSSECSEPMPVYSEKIDATMSQVVITGFEFSNGDCMFVQLEAINQAGLSTTANSSGYIIDLTPVELELIVDGSDPSSDLEYQSSGEILSVSWSARDEESNISQIEGAVYELREGRRIRVYPDPLSSDAVTEIISETSVSWQVNTSLVSGSKYIAAVTFTNGAGLRAQYETNGVLVDTTPPFVESVVVLSDTYFNADSGDMVTVIANPNLLEVRWIADDPESGIFEYLVGVVNDNLTLVTPYTNFGTTTGGLIENLNLPPGGEYRVVLISVNRAGLQSEPTYSDSFRVAPGDSAGVVYDGEDPSFIDVDYTDELTAITAQFYGFFSQSCGGISSYEWAVGGESSRESVLPFTDSGVVVIGINGSGYAQVLLPDLDTYEDQPLYITVRGITGCGDVLESTSNGFVIDPSPPSLEVISTGYRAIERAQSADGDAPVDHEAYQSTAQFSSVWQVGDEDSGVTDDIMVKTGTYPGGADIESERAVAENYIRRFLTEEEGLPNYITVSAQNRAGLESVAVSKSVSLDTSSPTGGELICDPVGHPEAVSIWLQGANTGFISCEWRGVSDPESDIIFYTVTVGTSPSDQSVSSGIILAGDSKAFETPRFEFSTDTAYYVTLYPTNGAGLEGVLISSPVYFDTSPPVFEGYVHVVPNFVSANFTSLAELGEVTASSLMARCLLDTDVAMVLFEEADDPETEVDRYEVGLGYSPGNDDLRSFQRFDPALHAGSIHYHLLTPLDFAAADRRAVYFNVKVCNRANLCSVLSSDPVFIKSELNTLPDWIYDGENLVSDIDYHIANATTISGYFRIGTNCPLASARWAVESVDGMIVQDYVDINLEVEISSNAVDDTNTIFVTTDQVEQFDDETYRILLQAVDLAGEVHILRSNGTTATTRSLRPGVVKDGPIIGQDLNHQESTTTLYAQWSGFGDGSPEQEIAYYEVAAGSFREFPNTKTNIAPFTNVGLNESHTFADLDLIPRDVVYYVTVRARAVSGAYVDVTSNGITVGFEHEIIPGRITVPQYQSDTESLSVYWREFESDLPIRSYEWALGSRFLTSEELGTFCSDTESNHSTAFKVFGFRSVDLDTAATASGLSLAHNTSYYVTIRAIDQAKKCLAVQHSSGVLIDITAPESRSDVSVGPPESLINIPDESEFVVYIQLSEQLDATWETFVDYESGVERYEVAVYEQTECGNNTLADDVTPLFEYMTVGTDLRITFVGLNFATGVSYVVAVRAINFVGLSSSIYSQPIVVDSTPLLPGTVKDGLNWESDFVFQSDLSMLSGVFTHAKLSPQYPGEVRQPGPCPQTTFYTLSGNNSAWSRLETDTPLGGVTAIVFEEQRIDFSLDPPGVEITAIRDDTSERILSGAYQTSAQISNGGTVSLDVLAARGTPDLQDRAVTSVVFIDSGSTSDLLAEFELGLLGSYEYPTTPEFSAFGLQIHHSFTNGTSFEPQKIVMWATSSDPLASPSYIVREITTDLTEVHTYTFDFQFEQLNVDYVRKVDLYIDGTLVSSLQGLPRFSADTRIVLHVFNSLGYIPPIENGFTPPKVIAVFANVTLPLRTSHLCDYGTPFFSEESPIVQFWAGAGTTPGSLDVRQLELISVPCHPCLPSFCPSYGCDPNCTIVDPNTVPFTFYNLTLSPGYYTNFSQSDAEDEDFEFESTNQNEANTMISLLTNHFQPSVYYITVHAISASGKTLYSVSNGVTIDTTPPNLISPIEHFDASFEFAQPTSFQGDDSTISAQWRFHDPESGVTENFWAIGTTPYGQDVQAYESIGMATEAANASLAGILEHNTTYYVSVIATNGAGLSANATSGGVTYIATELNRTEVEVFVQVESTAVFSVPGENGTQLQVLLAELEDRASITWEGVSEDVEEIFWEIGSEPVSDDIFPRTEVGFDEATSATIEGGVLFISSAPFANISEVLALAEGRDEDPDDNSFFFEPGRFFYHSLELCNFVHRCVIVETMPSIVIRIKDSEALSANGEDVTIAMTQEIPDGVAPADLPVLNRRHTVDIATSGGLEPGSRLYAGFLNDSDVTQRYRVSLPYISNPAETMVQTSRELARRFTEVGGPSFYVSFLGQDSLSGPLAINTTFDPTLDWSNASPDLGYWDVDEQVWREVNASCTNGSRIDWPTFTIAAQMCSTVLSSEGVDRPQSLTRRRRQVSITVDANDTSSGIGSGLVDSLEPELSFLDRPTQFIVMRIGNFSTNTAPRLNLPAEPIQIAEDESLAMFSLVEFVEDFEGDAVDFYLASLPSLGNATLTLDGVLTYTPCPNCTGMDMLEVYIMERPFGINTTPLSDTGLLRFEIANINDPPEILFYRYDTSNPGTEFDITTNRTISSFIDANRTSPAVVASVLAFDFDAYEDDLTILVRDGDSGSAGYQIWLDAVNTPESLPANWLSGSLVDSFTSYVTFVAFNLTYLPEDASFIGTDEINVRVRDSRGVFSDTIAVSIEVLPSLCENDGVCAGSDSDPDCNDIVARRAGFEGYNCSCLPGFGGQYCEIPFETPEPPSRVCPEGIPVLQCDGDPCAGAVCPSHPSAECRANYCGKCRAEWYQGDTLVQCNADDPSVCNVPNPNIFTNCGSVTCDCPSQPFQCPEDSILIETRLSDCCVSYECSCPSVSCPLLMECGQGVQPIPRYRGNGFPGRCCPDYNYEDINECLAVSQNTCSDICVNEDLTYSCSCPTGTTLAQDGVNCGVCVYNGMEYLYGDRIKIGCNWCICRSDGLSGERWHCTERSCDRGCILNGLFYPVNSVVTEGSVACTCVPTDTNAQWECTLDL